MGKGRAGTKTAEWSVLEEEPWGKLPYIWTHQDSCWGKWDLSNSDQHCSLEPWSWARLLMARWLCAIKQNGTRFTFTCLADTRNGLGAYEVLPSLLYRQDLWAWSLFPRLERPPKVLENGCHSAKMRILIHWIILVLAKPVILFPLNVNCITSLKLDAGHRHIQHCPPPDIFWRLQNFHSISLFSK